MNGQTPRTHFSRYAMLVLAVVILVMLLVWSVTLIVPTGGSASEAYSGPYAPAVIERGKYLAQVGDCVACHTAPGGRPFAGGLAVKSPLGIIYSSNITPDKATGIGTYTYGEFERAVRRGVGKSGESLYPAMPYPSYSMVRDEDVKALYAYFMQGVEPVNQSNKTNGIPWPLSMRWPLAYWRWMFAPRPVETVVAADQSMIDRGAYLVEGLGHCGACHTPRAVTLQEKALSGKDGNVYLSGGEVDDWVAPSLRADDASGIGAMSQDQLAALLKSGRSDNSAIFGGMSDVVHHSLQYLTDQDVQDIAAYLKSLQPEGRSRAPVYDSKIADALYHGDASMPGGQLYIDNCAACHRTSGKGYAQTFPALALNPVVNSANPDSLIHIVLSGSVMPGTQEAPTQFAMPSFADRLTDADVAQLVSFIRSSWGNHASPVSEAQVRKMRGEIPKPQPGMTDFDPRNLPASP